MTFTLGRRREKSRGGRRLSAPLLLPLLALALALASGFSGVLRRQLETAAGDQAETLLSEAAATALDAAFSDRKNLSSDVVAITRGEDGAITSVTTLPGALSSLSASFQTKLREALSDRGRITIPAGNLTGSTWLSGRGANLTFRTILSSAAVTNIRSEFRAVGINQTLHRVIFETTASVTVLLPGKNVTREIKKSFPAAETVIVGRVPDVYLQQNE